jgi:polysaccharide biosynthesis/export protein ExoF
MSEQPQAAGLVDRWYQAYGLDSRSAGRRSPSRGIRVLLAIFLLFSLATICVFAVTAVHSRTSLTNSFQTLSDGWTRLLSVVPRLFDPQPAMSQVSATVHPDGEPISLATAPTGEAGDVISYGDRLKISFIESAGVPLVSGKTESTRVVAVVFPRMDLSGEYTVDPNGGLSIPKLGRVAAADKSTTALQSELKAAFERVIGRTSDVHVAVLDRLPVYVVGSVRAAGTFKYVPGMIVMQALANAGGFERTVSDTSIVIENIRETVRLRAAKDKLNRLLIKQARLIAAQGNAETITVPASIASHLSQAATHDRLNQLIAAAEAFLNAERKRYRDQQVLAARQIEVVKMQLDAQKLRADQLGKLLAKKDRRLRDLQVIGQRGSIPQPILTQAEIEIAELVARQEDFRVALVQTQRSLVEAESAQAKINIDRSVGIEAELSATDQDIDNCVHEIASMQAVIQALQNSVGGAPSGGLPRLSVTRRVRGHFAVTSATETTALLPGDVVRVEFASEPDKQVPADAKHS